MYSLCLDSLESQTFLQNSLLTALSKLRLNQEKNSVSLLRVNAIMPLTQSHNQDPTMLKKHPQFHKQFLEIPLILPCVLDFSLLSAILLVFPMRRFRSDNSVKDIKCTKVMEKLRTLPMQGIYIMCWLI